MVEKEMSGEAVLDFGGDEVLNQKYHAYHSTLLEVLAGKFGSTEKAEEKVKDLGAVYGNDPLIRVYTTCVLNGVPSEETRRVADFICSLKTRPYSRIAQVCFEIKDEETVKRYLDYCNALTGAYVKTLPSPQEAWEEIEKSQRFYRDSLLTVLVLCTTSDIDLKEAVAVDYVEVWDFLHSLKG